MLSVNVPALQHRCILLYPTLHAIAAYPQNKPASSSGRSFNTSGESQHHRYVPPDLHSATKAPSKSSSKSLGSSSRRSGSGGAGESVSVHIKPSSFHSNASSKPTTQGSSSAASDRHAGNSTTTKFSSAGAATIVSGSATLTPSDAPDSISEHAQIRSIISTASGQRVVVKRDSSRSLGSGGSEADSQYLDAMMNSTRSALELDFCSSDLGQDRPRSNVIPLRQLRKPSQVATKGAQLRSGRQGATASPGDSEAFSQRPVPRHVHDKEPCSIAPAVEGTGRSAPVQNVDKDESQPDAERLLEAPQEAPSSHEPLLRGEISDHLDSLAPPSPAQSPIAACSSLPLVSPQMQPRVGDILGGRFLLRRVVGTSPSAIIYGANDLQEGSVPCSVRIPAPNTPLAASMIALGRMQWLRGKLSHSEGATSLVRILSMPNLLGHGIVVATESLEASVRGRMNLIGCGRAKRFSNSDLRSLARQVRPPLAPLLSLYRLIATSSHLAPLVIAHATRVEPHDVLCGCILHGVLFVVVHLWTLS